VPIIIIIFIVAQAFGNTQDATEMDIANMIVVAFFFLLRPGDYTGTLADDAAFKIEDVSLYVQICKLDFITAPDAEIKASNSACYTFTAQKNHNHVLMSTSFQQVDRYLQYAAPTASALCLSLCLFLWFLCGAGGAQRHTFICVQNQGDAKRSFSFAKKEKGGDQINFNFKLLKLQSHQF
jgi:hypothetical protein